MQQPIWLLSLDSDTFPAAPMTTGGLKAYLKLLNRMFQVRHALRSLLTAAHQPHLRELSTPPCLLHVLTGRHHGVRGALLQL